MADPPVAGPSPRRARKFAYDVGVNILANLVAAAVIYLAAVAGGYISKSPYLLAASVVLTDVAIVFALSVAFDTAWWKSWPLARRLVVGSTLLLAIVFGGNYSLYF